MIVKWLISGCGTTTSMMIVCTPIILLPEASYAEDSFLSIMYKLSETSPYFSEIYDTTGRVGLTPLQKCITVVHQLAYSMVTYMIYEYLKLGKSTALECPKYYCLGIIEYFGAEFVRRPGQC
jgi:hypothetical protein